MNTTLDELYTRYIPTDGVARELARERLQRTLDTWNAHALQTNQWATLGDYAPATGRWQLTLQPNNDVSDILATRGVQGTCWIATEPSGVLHVAWELPALAHVYGTTNIDFSPVICWTERCRS